MEIKCSRTIETGEAEPGVMYVGIVALMVFEHQMRMINLITRIGWETRVALSAERLNPRTGAAPDRRDLPQNLREGISEFVDYLLFIDEAPLAGKVEGTSGFTAKFAARSPRDGKGRSLRQFDLERRLMRYPCSYMIHAEAFDGLPAAAKDAIYTRMWQVLSGEERDARYSRLTIPDRRAIVEILLDTKKDLPAWFKPLEP